MPYSAVSVPLANDKTLHRGWTTFLQWYEWQWFCTLTFRDMVHPESADKRFRTLISKLNRELFGPRWSKKPNETAYWTRGIEYQKRDVLHFHALVGCHSRDLNSCTTRRQWADEWNELAGFARIEKIRSAKEAARYVTKYVTKGGQIDLSPNIISAPRSGDLFDSGTNLAAQSAHLA